MTKKYSRYFKNICIFLIVNIFCSISIFLKYQSSTNHYKSDLEHQIKRPLYVNLETDIQTFDPRKGSDFISATISTLLFEGLLRSTPQSDEDFGLAKKIEVSSDKLTYTLHLREAYWSNGDPITAFDFVQTWHALLQPSFPCPTIHLFYAIKNAKTLREGRLIKEEELGLKALNAHTLQIQLEHPNISFSRLLASCFFSPVHASMKDDHKDNTQKDYDTIICNGPYRLKKYVQNNEIILEKNPYYWDRDNVFLEKIHIHIIHNPEISLQLYNKGEIDILGFPFSQIPEPFISQLQKKESIHFSQISGSALCYFHLSSFPFYNAHIRRAFAYAIKREEFPLINNNLKENTFFLPKNLYIRGLSKFILPNDEKDMAKMHLTLGLQELGIIKQQLTPIILLYKLSTEEQKIALLLQHQWEKTLGIHVTIKGLEKGVFFQNLAKNNYQIALSSWIAYYNDPLNFFERFVDKNYEKNYPQYINSTYTKCVYQASIASTEQIKSEYLDQAQQILLQEMPLIPLFHIASSYIKQEYLHIPLSPGGYFYLPGITFSKNKPFQKQKSS